MWVAAEHGQIAFETEVTTLPPGAAPLGMFTPHLCVVRISTKPWFWWCFSMSTKHCSFQCTHNPSSSFFFFPWEKGNAVKERGRIICKHPPASKISGIMSSNSEYLWKLFQTTSLSPSGKTRLIFIFPLPIPSWFLVQPQKLRVVFMACSKLAWAGTGHLWGLPLSAALELVYYFPPGITRPVAGILPVEQDWLLLK